MAAYTPQAGQTFGFGAPQVQQIQQQYGLTPQQLQSLQSGKAGQPTPTLGLGNTGYNLTMGAGGGNYMVTGGAKGTAPAPVQGPTPNVPGSPGSSTSTSTTNVGAGTPSIQGAFQTALLGQLKTDPNNIALTQPGLAPQMQAFQNAQQRSQQRAQQELAEQGFVGGTGRTGAYGAELGAMEQQRGEAEGQFGANLLGQEKEQRLASLFNALGLSQQNIASNQQYGLGMRDIDVRQQLGQGQLGLGLLSAMLQDRQTNNRLGADVGMFGANLNQNAVLQMLGL